MVFIDASLLLGVYAGVDQIPLCLGCVPQPTKSSMLSVIPRYARHKTPDSRLARSVGDKTLLLDS